MLSQAITAVNDAPVNVVGGTLTVAEDSGATNVTGISISDVDANPATDIFTVMLDVLNGTLNLSIAVPGGLGAGQRHRQRDGHDHHHRDDQPDQRDARRRRRPHLHPDGPI